MKKTNSKYYVTKGENGVIIKGSYADALRCQQYIRHSVVESYSSLEDAQDACLYHLSLIVPLDYCPPLSIEFDELVTVKRIMAEQDREEIEFGKGIEKTRRKKHKKVN